MTDKRSKLELLPHNSCLDNNKRLCYTCAKLTNVRRRFSDDKLAQSDAHRDKGRQDTKGDEGRRRETRGDEGAMDA
ncbi:hypothetical protein MCHI_001262 [Candidatus Magnetoovum chiemensis]|nr:hypothetical protein MCHI_001262 [Candidatus Magnetoovum chiemensis]